MNHSDDTWNKLVRTARHTPEADGAAPFGFATRVIATWRAGRRPQPSAWEILSLRSMAFALLVMVVCLGANYRVVTEQFAAEPDAAADVMALVADSE